VRPSFTMTEANVAAVVELCRQLDGLPLAIELAAARSKLLSPQALLSRLDSTLGSGVVAADRAERQRTLASTIAWSYDLLTPAEQEVFRKLGVFASQCDLAAVEAVLDISGVDPLDAVTHLVDVSLVRIVDGADGEPRVSLLETIAAFARRELEKTGQDHETRLAHARWCRELAEEMVDQVTGPKQVEALDRIAGIEEEIRQALDWCLRPAGEVGDERLQYGLALTRSMGTYWYRFGYAAEGRGWLSRALKMVGEVDSTETMNLLHGLGILQVQQGDLGPAITGLQRALEMARRLGDRSREARELNSLGIALRMQGELDDARQHIELSASIARERGEEMRLSTALSNLPMIFMDAEQWPEALQAARDAVAVSSRLDDDWGFVTDEFNLSMALLYVEGPTAALTHLARLTPRAVALADAELNVSVVEMFAAIHAELGDARMAGRLLAASDKSRKTLGMPRAAPDARLLERAFDSTGVRSTHEWTAGYEEGRTLDTDAAIAQALAASKSTEMVAESAE
jgi:tetratricopeptide (TPR) repeat protein